MSMFSGGYMGKVLRVDLTRKRYSVEILDEKILQRFLGGRGIAAWMYYHEIGPEVDPLAPANKVFFMTGPLTGVRLPSTTKLQLATKSPETRMYLCSNGGGDFGPRLKAAGFDGLVIEGKADDWTYLIIRDDEVTFADARSWKGLETDVALERLYRTTGDKRTGALAIGPAGEKLVRLTCINVDQRAFGRGGAGAVLGSKRLKGIAVHGSGTIPIADPEAAQKLWKESSKELQTSRANHKKYGTAQYIELINDLGCMPTRNFQTSFFEGCDKVDARAMKSGYYIKNFHCFNCPVGCGMICEVKEGPYRGARARTEYETIALLGPNCGISDFGAIVAANQLCDKLGIDTMSAGNLVALTMELYERDLIHQDETMGIEARFGNPEALLGIIQLIANRRGIGDLLAEGVKEVVAKHPEWSPYILAVKGLPLAAYDPRGFYGNALTYGTSSRGACHNVGGWTIRAELQSGQYDRFALKGKGKLVTDTQDNRAYVDSLGLCTVVRGSLGFTAKPTKEVLKIITGYDFTPELLEIGERIYNLERLILNREGVLRKEDQIPERIVSEAIPSGPIKGQSLSAGMYNQMLDEYYQERGWDAEGIPTSETLARLGIKHEGGRPSH